MKNIKYLSIAAVIAVGLAMLGCQNAANSAANNTNKASNSNANAKPEATTAKTDSPAGSMATPTDTYKSAYAYRKNKDIEGLKKVMSQDILDFLKMMGEDDKKSLDDMLKELCDRPQAATAEARNEKITGETATIEYLDETGGWKTMDFEKIGSDWKMGAPKGAGKPGDAPKK